MSKYPDYRGIASKIHDRVSNAAGETAMLIDDDPRWAEDYGIADRVKEFKENAKSARGFMTDVTGSIGDELYNQSGFWSMARDWIGDELTQAGVKWNSKKWNLHYNRVCDQLAIAAPFISKDILSWKNDVPETDPYYVAYRLINEYSFPDLRSFGEMTGREKDIVATEEMFNALKWK